MEPKPVRRLVAYYAVLIGVGAAVIHFAPQVSGFLAGDHPSLVSPASGALETAVAGAASGQAPASTTPTTTWLFALGTALIFLSTLALMLPVTWVYMATAPGRRHNQSLVQTLILLPMVIAGIVLVVQNSLALAFSLTGVVAAVRFRTNLSEARDVVFVFLAIAIGFAAGVHLVVAGAYLSMIFNLVLLLIWRFDFGQNVLEPSASAEWVKPLTVLAERTPDGYSVPDRDLLLALTPKKVDVLSHRFERIRKRLGTTEKQPKYNAVVTITTNDISRAQHAAEKALDDAAKRWKLDEVVTNAGKPSELYYLVRTRKSMPRDALLTAIRECGPDCIASADVEIGEALAVEKSELHAHKKQEEAKALELQ
jgi:hypothetical protein